MKLTVLLSLTGLSGLLIWINRPPEPIAIRLDDKLPTQSSLAPTPRARFTPTPANRKGYYNIDVVGDFTIPATKTITFAGAGRNLHVQQDRDKIFRRGFTTVERTRMVPGVEISSGDVPPAGWKSVLKPSQRALVLYQDYFANEPFNLSWARNSEQARSVTFRPPPGARTMRNTLYNAASELSGGCVGFGDCPSTGWKSTYGKVFLDIENEGTSPGNLQEQVNLYTFMAKTIKENVSPQTEIGSIAPVPHNSFGYSSASNYTAEIDPLWSTPARYTTTSRRRGMPDEIVGKSFGDYVDFQMPGTYYVYPDFDYSARHTGDSDRHWLAALLQEQEVNKKLSPKKRIAWHWLFNTQSGAFPNSSKAEHPAPPAVAEGMAIFYWFTGAYGILLWDDHKDLNPDQPSPGDPAQKGTANDRNYACYEHYIHGLWRLFKHHGNLFNGRETYLNEQTELSFDGGQTWYKYNANQLKTRDLPFVRAVVNGDQILVAATKPYAQPGQTNQVMLRYVQNGYNFYTTISLKGDEIYLGRATMTKGAARRELGRS